jgi:tape measure domain-containing protein
MAGIKEVYELVDRATAPLRDIEKAMGGVVNQTVNLNITLNENSNTQRVVEQSMRQTDTAAKALSGTIGKLVAAFGGLALIKKVIDLSDELTMTQARLNNVNDGLQTTAELQNLIYQAAQRSRGSYAGMMQTVASLKAQTGDTFSSVREAIAFTELLNKQFKIAGADATAIASTMYNLTQALSTGVLRGQDLNIVMSNAPQIAQRIAKAMNVSVGELKELASQGQVTSDVVKRAMLDSADDINKQFEDMPKTFGDLAQEIKNIATKEFQPIGQMLSDAINSGEVEQSMSVIGDALYLVMGIFGEFASEFIQGLNIVLGGLVQTSGQVGVLGTAFVYLVGLACGAEAIIYNAFAHLGNFCITIAELIQNTWAQMSYDIATAVIKFAEGAVRAFSGVVRSAGQAATAIGNAFVKGANIAIGGINKLIDAINKIPGVNIGGISELAAPGNAMEGMADALDGVADALAAMEPDSPIFKMYDRFDATSMEDAFNKGSNAGKDWAQGLLEGMGKNNDYGDYGDILSGIEENTANAVPNGSGGNVGSVGKVKKVDNVKLSDEDLKIYRDLAERRYMNNIELKTLAPEINVTLPAGASGNITAQDVADKLKRMLIAEMAAQTAVSHA